MRKRIFKFFLSIVGLKSIHNTKKRGTIILMIDGLSFDALQYALKKNYCPTLKRLSTSHRIYNYYCGLPASTTATEALLFYGNNYNIPGFTWFDRKLQTFIRGSRTTDFTPSEDILKKRRTLLQKGSVIMSVYSGGATELNICNRNFTISHSLYFLKVIQYLLAILLYPTQLIRTVYLILRTLLFYRNSHQHSVKETLVKIVLGHLSCFLVEIEIFRNVEKIFVNFLLYDRYGHKYGPKHKLALSTLRIVDRYINRIIHTVKDAERSYELILLSDHGQTESIPFDFPHIQSVPAIEHALDNATYRVIKTYGGIPIHKDKKELYLVPGGSMLHLYFSENLTTRPDELTIEKRFPHFISRLLRYEKFGWVLVKQKNESASLYGKTGNVTFHGDNSYEIQGLPFPHIPEHEMQKIIMTFQTYWAFPNNGDLVIFGNVTKDQKVYSFEKNYGTHGGFYGLMTQPFIMTQNPMLQKTIEKDSSMEDIFNTIQTIIENNV